MDRNSNSTATKKEDLSHLKNWWPISLINVDAKIFTHLLNTQISTNAQHLINPRQTGFMPNRFIATSGLLARIIIEHAQHHNNTAVGLLLDQEKAYDRIHSSYLTSTLNKFGFPTSIVHSIAMLFFNTHIRININGHLSNTLHQQQGL